MTNSLPPTNYQWTGNNLTYILPVSVTGLKIKYKKAGTTNWILIYESLYNAPTSINLPASLGPTGTIWGVTSESESEGWGEPDEEEITNQPE